MILVDTGPLVALCDARDGKHGAAVKQLEIFATEEFAICEAVLTETCFHLPYAAQRQRLRALLQQLRIHPVPVMYHTAFWMEVFQWLAKYSDHEPDWADGCLAVLCGRDTQLKVWTYDRQFRTTWRRPDGTAIPLAVRTSGRRD